MSLLQQRLARLERWLRLHPVVGFAVVAVIALAAEEAFARVGGGSSYSGRSRSSGSGSGGSGGGGGSGEGLFFLVRLFFMLPWWMELIIVIVVVIVLVRAKNKGGQLSYGGGAADDDASFGGSMGGGAERYQRYAEDLPASWGERGRAVDPGFSEVLFLERAVLLVTRLFEAAPNKANLAELAPYVVPAVAQNLSTRSAGIVSVKGVTVGRIAIAGLDAVGGAVPMISVRVQLHLNRHVVRGAGETSFYSHEEWTLVRPVGRPPIDENNLTRFGCPGCGSPLERDAMGRCTHCQTSLTPGAADWTVRAMRVLSEENKGPLLTQNVVEVGTDAPTVKDHSVGADAERILGGEERVRFLGRAKDIFVNLQTQWTAKKLDGLRPWETDALFQSHRFWIEEYQRQRLTNVVDQLQIKNVELCRVEEDGDHVSAVCRIHASCRDYTIDDATQKVRAGSQSAARAFTEYWTFVKHKGAKGAASMANCPSCGAPLQISQSGVCEYCQSKVTLGRFDWVASRIEQDEEVSGG